MTRPVDSQGRKLDAAHKRLKGAPAVLQKIVFALAEDHRTAGMSLTDRVRLAERAIDVVIDGGEAPKKFKGGGLLAESWRRALGIANAAVAFGEFER